MSRQIQHIIEDFDLLNISLRARISFFAQEGNVFLAADNKYKEESLLTEYKKTCLLNLNFKDIALLPQFHLAFARIAKQLVEATESSPNDRLDKLLQLDIDLLIGDSAVLRFCELLQECHRLLLDFYSYLTDSYSLRILPIISIQEIIAGKKSDFRYFHDVVDIPVEVNGLKINGRPDPKKLSEKETESQKFKILISSQTDVLQKLGYCEQNFGDAFLEDYQGRISLEYALEDTYSELYTFAYTQILSNKIDYAQFKINFAAKFPDIKLLITDRCLKLNVKDEYIDYINSMADEVIFPLDYPHIYAGKFRVPTDFEKDIYNCFASLDLYSYPAKHQNSELISTIGVTFANSTYDLVEQLICGSENNSGYKIRQWSKSDSNIYEQALVKIAPITMTRDQLKGEADQAIIEELKAI